MLEALSVFLICLTAGTVGGICGIGGGPFHLAVLTFFFSMDAKEAAVNSLLVILISQLAVLCVALAAHTVPSFPRMYLALMIAAGIISGVLASHCRGKMSSAAVEKLLNGIILLTVGICLYNAKRMLF